MTATPGLRALAAAGVVVSLHPYDYDREAEAIGLAAARALGLDAGLVLKTLMVEVDGKPACCVLPSDRQLSMKKVAAGFGGKQAEMMKPDKAERLTGYRVGGISPFGQKRAVPTAFDAAPMTAPKVWINAGMRGLLLGIAPQDALRVAQGLSFGLTP
jgi:Cys-tRNA(Pro)/Cys-tRNA(Cys) deacylase